MNEQPQNDSSPAATPTSADSAPAEEAISNDVLKKAYNAFKKRWKLTRLDYESRIGRSPLSGSSSAIVGIAAPRDFPKPVWDELVKQGRLKNAGSGLYSMP
jgi:hypothetical protein